MAAGVFSTCKMAWQTTAIHTNDCCDDPVIHERINEEIKTWLYYLAPGVRNSLGCPTRKGSLAVKNTESFDEIIILYIMD